MAEPLNFIETANSPSSLKVTIKGQSNSLFNSYHIEPPLFEAEAETIIEKVGHESEIGKLLVDLYSVGTATNPSGGFCVYRDGRSDQSRLELGLNLVKELALIRGLQVGEVAVKYIDSDERSFIVFSGRYEGKTVIDVDEFKDAQADPKAKAFYKK